MSASAWTMVVRRGEKRSAHSKSSKTFEDWCGRWNPLGRGVRMTLTGSRPVTQGSADTGRAAQEALV